MTGALKALWAAAIIVCHLSITATGRLLMRDPVKLRRFYLTQVSRHAHWLLRALAIELIVEGAENARPGKSYLIVANHLSYLDALVMAAFRPTSFVTSIEMRETPLLGPLTELGGCLYVERRRKENIRKEVAEVAEALRQGSNVVVFPEATSTDGEQVRPFKRPLFAAAVMAVAPVLPAVIQYEALDGRPVTRANRDTLCWYGDMGFGGHFLRLAMRKNILIRLRVLPEIPVTANTSRDTLMEEAYQRIQAHYRPIEGG